MLDTYKHNVILFILIIKLHFFLWGKNDLAPTQQIMESSTKEEEFLSPKNTKVESSFLSLVDEKLDP